MSSKSSSTTGNHSLPGSPGWIFLQTGLLPPSQIFTEEASRSSLGRDTVAAIKRLASDEGATLFMALLAAFQTLVQRYTGQDDIAVGSPIANRNRIEIEGVVGFFVNSLVLRTDLSGDPTFREALRRVREITLKAYEFQDAPFEKLVEELAPERDFGQNAFFQIMFALQNLAVAKAARGRRSENEPDPIQAGDDSIRD